MKSISLHQEFPDKPGLYAFMLGDAATLKEFGIAHQVVYAGKAEDSLKKRDLNTHFNNKGTGRSTLRRSIGAILKQEIKATAFTRNGTLDRPNIDNYKFDTKAEARLSEWMNDNLLFGYWVYEAEKETEASKAIEEQLIIALKPTLDLDKRTSHLNRRATGLIALRNKCKEEARQNVVDQIEYY